MSQISQFLRKGDGFVSHWCPGCLAMHSINTEFPNILGAQWQWDGNIVAPTFSPSIHLKRLPPPTEHLRPPKSVCHYFLRAGVLEFLGDCEHEMRGIKMQLPPLPEFMRDKCQM